MGGAGQGGSNGQGGSAAKDGGVAGTGGGSDAGTKSDTGGSTVSFSKDILPMLNTSCKSCHSPPSPNAGVDVTTYSAVKSSATSINSAIQRGIMPPTGALSSANKQLIQSWVTAGEPNN